jgi:poly(hydroxyalkanoate) depolymerase family esterase
MNLVDWRALYASNQAAIERAGGGRRKLPTLITGERRSRYHVHSPRDAAPGTALPLVCLLHGCTQDAASLAAATRMNEAADRHGFAVLYPEQDRGRNPQRCWNWFRPEHQARGAGEPAAIAAAVRELLGTTSSCTIDARRVFVAGLSAGGAMAMVLAYTYPDLFAAVAVHSGLAYRSAADVNTAFSAMARGPDDRVALDRAAYAAMGARARAIPSMVIHGSADDVVAPVNAGSLLAQAVAANRLAAPATCGDLAVSRPSAQARGRLDGGHPYVGTRWTDRRGALMHELLAVEGMGHAWSGGAPGVAWSDPRGPSATEAIWRFFGEAARDVA